MSEEFSHIDKSGNPKMVNVGNKEISFRKASARAKVKLGAHIVNQFVDRDIQTKKGPVFKTAIIAGVMAAKRTPDLIPFCHSLNLDNCIVDISIVGEEHVEIQCTCSLEGKTGVEMEAMTGATVAALTIYDMCKALSKEIVIEEIVLLSKTGGKSDYFRKITN